RDQISEADLEEAHRLLQRAVAKSQLDAESHRYVGILQFRSTGLGTTLDGFSELLEAYLTEALAKAPEVVVLEREQLRYLQREQDLTGLQLQLRTSALLLEGGVRFIDGQSRIRVELVFRRLGTDGENQIRTMDLPADEQSRAANLQEITIAILDYLNVHPPAQGTTNRSQEAGLFLKQVPLLLASGRFEDAISKAEVALALKPDQEARFWTARAWYRQAESIRPNFDYSRRPAHMRSRIRRVTDAGVPSRSATPPVDEDNNAEEAKLRTDLHRLLTSLIRAYSIGRDLTRWHINGAGLSVIPDPFGPQPMFDPNDSSRQKPRLVDMLQEQDTRGRQLFEQLRQLRRDAISQQKSYYEEHYHRSPEMADAYWQVWFKMKEFMFDYSAYDQAQINTFTANVFKAFSKAADGDLETRLRGIKPLIQLQPGAMLAPADVTLYSQLITSPDPWTRLLAHRQMIREDFLKHSDAVLQIFQQDILPENKIWDFSDANLVPAYLRTAIHRLAVSDPAILIKYYAAIFDLLVQPAH
ncbi:MAG: hypothetical protein K8I00_10800, partial [Candidatus Omnitrophica bacterium]|nr:hypothetical protein [Candidatus Omnitrophota bacterium]